ncbi:MAG: response regulator [Desulfuromonadales bacterium]|jgi:uncharacterized protein (TIGR02266 family)|nr:response regulator [Desulfuromonadales bacterium]
MKDVKTTGSAGLNDFGRAVKILLVDDVELFLELEKTFFRRDDVDLLVAGNGEQALTVIADEKPDLVFLDLHMPGINGDEVCRRIKQSGQQLPVVMVIQQRSPEDEQLCRDAGCDDILFKPVRRRDFIAAAGKILAIRERILPRIDASLRISFGLQPKKYLENFSVNLSEGGLFIATGAILTVGTLLNVEFQLTGRTGPIQSVARVVWVNHPDWIRRPKLPVGMGVEFLDLGSESLEMLQLFVEDQISDGRVG